MARRKRNPRVLIIRLNSIGDVLFCTPVAQALRELYPQGRISWLVEEKSKEVVEGNPFLDEVIVWPRLRWRKERAATGLLRFLRRHLRFLWQVRRGRFDAVLDLQGMIRSALLAWLSGARQRVGFQHAQEMAGVLYNHWVVTRPSAAHVSQEYLLAASFLGANPSNVPLTIPFSEQDRASAHRLLHSALRPDLALGESGSRLPPRAGGRDTPHSALPYAIFCPAVSRPHKLWPAERYAQVADWVSENAGMTPVFLAGKQDSAYIETIRTGCRQPTVSLAGRTSLKQAAALIAESQLVVGADTALTHVGVAFGKPVAALFGAAGVNYQPRGPLQEAVRADCDCAPCWTRVQCAANYKCMTGIQPERVVAAVRRVLAAAQARRR